MKVAWFSGGATSAVACKIALDIVDNDCYENSDVKAQKILDLIKEYS